VTETAAYAEHAPAALLRHPVECYWSRTGPAAPGAVHRVLPDGCSDIIIELAGGAAQDGDGGGAAEPRSALVVGTMTRPLVVPAADGERFVAVRFRPGWARALLGIPAAALADERVPLEDVWRDAAGLHDAIAAAATAAERVRALEQALVRRLPAVPEPPRDVRAAVRLVFDAGGRISVDALARTLGVSRQHLARRFAEHVGVPPKMLCRIVRARRVVERVRRERSRGAHGVNWSALALDAGYYDQAHLIADFGELTGLTPERWLAAQ
jgi:AraC-like DNA-binding protein